MYCCFLQNEDRFEKRKKRLYLCLNVPVNIYLKGVQQGEMVTTSITSKPQAGLLGFFLFSLKIHLKSTYKATTEVEN